MTPLRVLFIVSELAPFTGESASAKEHRFLSRALAEMGVDVTIALPGHAVPEGARGGLARRLSPYELSPASSDADGAGGNAQELVIFEGSVGDSRVSVLVLDRLASDEQASVDTMRTLARAAMSVTADRDAEPDVIFATHGSEAALAELEVLASEDHGTVPAIVFLVRDVMEPALPQVANRADRVVLPSAAYADALLAEIANERMGPASRQLSDVADRLCGVPAGTDPLEWNPHQDSALVPEFPRDPLAGKAAHKRRLRDELGLRPQSDAVPLVAIVGPIGESILTYGMVNSLAQAPIHMVALADPATDAKSMRHLQRASNQNPHEVVMRTFEDRQARTAFERQLLAAADFALVPRDFSPAPLCDLHVLHYGALPIAPQTGWAADYLVEVDSLSRTGNGFLFEPFNGDHLLDALQRALRAYARKESFAAIVEQAMTIDLSWRATAQRYINVIVDMMKERRARHRDAV